MALVSEGVGEDMHGQGWHAHIQLVADVASLGSLWGELPGTICGKAEGVAR